MKNTANMLSRIFRLLTVWTALLLCLALSFPVIAEEEGRSEGFEDRLPQIDYDDYIEQEPEEDDRLPDFGDEEVQKQLPLPNPGSFFGEGQLRQSGYTYRGRPYDLYLYRQLLNWDTQLNAYLEQAQNRGYTMSAERLDGMTAYILSDGEKQAILFLKYGGKEQFLFMLEKGFEMEEAVMEIKPLKEGDVFVTINGAQYPFSGLRMKQATVQDCYWGVSPYSTNWDGSAEWGTQKTNSKVLDVSFKDEGGTNFQIAVPEDARTGSEYHLTSVSNRAIRLALFGTGYVYGTTVVHNGYNLGDPSKNGSTRGISQFESDKDKLDVYILYRSATEIRGEFDGVFNDGKTTVHVEFWLPIK